MGYALTGFIATGALPHAIWRCGMDISDKIIIFASCLRKYHSAKVDAPVLKEVSTMGMQHAVILEIQQWIDDNLERPLRIEDVATRAGYSKWHLQRLFQQVIQIPLGIYIREKKLESAAHELLATEQSIMAISTKYGYDSQQTFTRTFTRKYQMPPGVWRRQHQR